MGTSTELFLVRRRQILGAANTCSKRTACGITRSPVKIITINFKKISKDEKIMFKKLKLSLLILCLPFAAFAADFEAGNQYEVLKVEKSATPQVTEFFSFYCPHCFQFEPVA